MTDDYSIFLRDLSHVQIGSRTLGILTRAPSFLTKLVPTFTPIRNMVSHIRQYEFAKRFLSGKNVLDIACGTGYGSEILRWNHNNVVGVDINPSNISFARSNFPRNIYELGNAENLHFFSNETFDAVVSIQTIEHLWHPKEAIKGIHRILKTDGLLIGAVPINCKHKMSSQAETSDVFLFDDCYELITPLFEDVLWFYHNLLTNTFRQATESWLRSITKHSGDIVFVAHKENLQ